MYLENLVMDAVDPQRLGRFWESVVGGERLTDEPIGFETRLAVQNGPVLDLCFQRVPEPPSEPVRLHLRVSGGDHADATVERLLSVGARRLGHADDDGPDTVLTDPEGNPFSVTRDPSSDVGTGPLASLRLDCADPDREGDLWSWLTGWTDASGLAPRTLRHRSMRGPALELYPERSPKGTAKNRRHLDIRLEPDDDPDDVAAGVAGRGGRELRLNWGDLPWRHFADASGNEFCLLPSQP